MTEDRAEGMNLGPDGPQGEENRVEGMNLDPTEPLSEGDPEVVRHVDPMSEGRAEAINLGPNNPPSEAEVLREEAVAERINPGDQHGVVDYPEQKARRISPGPNDLDPNEIQHANGVETLDEKKHRIDPGPRG